MGDLEEKSDEHVYLKNCRATSHAIIALFVC
jgi:hypothetical protein